MPEIIAHLEAVTEPLSHFMVCDQFPVCAVGDSGPLS
jgi:hypothetical protein